MMRTFSRLSAAEETSGIEKGRSEPEEHRSDQHSGEQRFALRCAPLRATSH